MKKILSFLSCLIMLFCLASCGQSNEDYTAKLISVMNEQEATTVKDIFSFEFDRAYIFHQADCYFDGETFAKTYNLDISIDQVDEGIADYRQRIVFVNKSGDFVHLFECNADEVYINNKGVVIYPETVIKRKLSQAKLLEITFETSEQYSPQID